MDITNAEQAEQWLRAWSHDPRPGILGVAIDGLRTCRDICNARTYSDETRAGYDEAIAILSSAQQRQEMGQRNADRLQDACEAQYVAP